MPLKNQRERETLLLGALLHDIGKFWQRTGEKYDKFVLVPSFKV